MWNKIDNFLHMKLEENMIGAFWTMIAFMSASFLLKSFVYFMILFRFDEFVNCTMK